MRALLSPRPIVAAACACLWLVALGAADRSPAAMADAATSFLDSLSDEQRAQATFGFDADERLRWHFIPTERFARNGLTIGAMSASQQMAAHALLQAGLSQRGYLTATTIMDLESVLRELEQNGRFNRDPQRYFFSVFGRPAAKGAWAWRVEGHHLSVHIAVVNGSMVASSPMFFGSNPAEVREGPRQGLRVLGAQEDAARALLMALDDGQRARAIISATAPDDIVTMNAAEVSPLESSGIAASYLSHSQRDLLMTLIDSYSSAAASDIAADRMARLKASGTDDIVFAWAGEPERGKRHYYRVQGPTFLIEYDNTQNDGNHVHSVWRDFDGDFGRDLLREHLAAAH